jgi:hypothetical protein
MVRNNKNLWLKRILVVKIALSFLFWGLPFLFFPLSFLQRSGVSITGDPIYLRLLGAVILALGVAYWYAWKDPVHNVAILKAGVVDNGLVTLVTLYFVLFQGFRSTIMLISALLTLFFFISFILLMPKADAA